ncbi:DUF2158 domain-containing protein [Pseudomonas sp. 02C 26]|uniref:YodC family protein n=1 Tax=unclassified Pseudomonas TaxID=196821 RepID=UPI000C6DA70C|nr:MULTISPECIES: DUF2158 domain-containing protein [unclassified Pseudomonas]AUF98827.1 DUF2158 domain-containing protein [Pseudomonas sp. 02C 26]
MATEDKFAVGDIVKLKSGGPAMTVQAKEFNSDYYVCQWFAGKKLESGRFKTDSLESTTLEAK